MRINGGGVNIF